MKHVYTKVIKRGNLSRGGKIMKQFTYLFNIFLFFFALTAYCQDEIDVVYLKNGSIINGKIFERVIYQSIKIKVRESIKFVYKFEEIKKMVKENVGDDGDAFSISEPQTSGFIGTISVGIGYIWGDDPENFMGINIGGSAGYVFSNSIGARLDIAYNRFGLDNPVEITTIRGDFLIGNFKKKSKIVPYGLLGLGIYSKNSNNGQYIDTLGNEKPAESEFGLGLGGGVGFKVYKSAAIFIETQYNIGFGSDRVSSFLPVKVGVMITP
jgi:Outer membrane protein beta-barrel domain